MAQSPQNFPLPDGTYITDVPEGTTRAEIAALLINSGQAHRLGYTAPDPAEGMSEIDKVRAGWGKFIMENVTGVRQRLGSATTQDVEEMHARDRPLMETTAGKAGYYGSALGHGAAAGLIPGVNTLAGSTALGAGFGLAQPTTRYEDPAANMIRSAGFGAIGQMAGRVASGAPIVTNRNPPATQNLVDLATKKYGIDLPTSVRAGSPRAGYVESQLATLPGGGAMQTALTRPQEQLAQAVMREAGAAGPATSETLRLAQEATKKGYQNIWRGQNVAIDGTFTTELSAAWSKAQRMLPKADQRVVRAQINNIWDKAAPASPTQMVIPGDVYQMMLRGEIRSAMPAQGPLRTALKDVMKALDGAANRSVGKSGGAALKDLNTEYAIQKELANLIPAAESRGGRFTPSGLLPRVGQFPGNISELAKIGPLLREPPQSGTATRAIVSGALLGGPAFLAGGALTAAAGLAAPFGASQLLSRPWMQRYLAEGFGSISPMQRELITTGTRAGALAAPSLLMPR